ncbi:MAG TPA: hypothetical protein VGE79_08485 [Niastella sp.]
MKAFSKYPAWTSVLCVVMILLNACKKHDPKPCIPRPPEAQWQLTLIESYFWLERPIPNDREPLYDYINHYFRYNADNLPLLHIEVTNLDSPVFPYPRMDSFIYNNRYQLIQTISTDFEGPGSYKRNFTYGPDNRKIYNLKYLLVNGQYVLTDSTVYRYQENNIRKIIYHLIKGGIDTAIFIYDAQKNLVSAKLGEYDLVKQQLLRYDASTNPANHFNMESLELYHFNRHEWNPEFLLMMQSPRFSRNNYQLRRNSAEYVYSFAFDDNNQVRLISSPRESVDTFQYLYQKFRYTAAK